MTEVRFIGVTKAYESVKAIDDVSIKMRSGEFTTILGPSGSGKTTILSLIAGIVMPTAGRIQIGARDITDIPPAGRNTGLVFQSYALFPHMTIFDNIAFPLRLRKVAATEVRARVNEALGQVRLEGYGARMPDQLSGGQQQRVALARAIVFKPDILLLDEPLAALDRNLREAVRIEIRALQRSLGITTVMVTHDQEEAMSLSDTVVLMSQGRVEQVGAPDDLYHRPRTRFASGFLGTANFLDGRFCGGSIVSAAGEAFGCHCASTAEGAAITGVLRPDEVRLARGEGAVSGTIIDVDFLGEVVRYALRTRGGLVLRAHVTGLHDRFAEGDTVHATWNPHRVWVLPDPGALKTQEEPATERAADTHSLHPPTERITP